MAELQRLTVAVPTDLKERIEVMSKETGLSQSQLILLALHSLTANYEEKGSFIFADLLNPENRKGGR